MIFPNGKLYIGQTIYDLEYRKSAHKKDVDRLNLTFYRAIRKYGWDNLIWEVIDIANNIEELNKKEIYWIKYYNTYINAENSNGYNLTLGGEGTCGYTHTDESKKKMSKSRIGKYSGENSPMYNKNFTKEHRIKMNKSKIGKYSGENNYNAKITKEIAEIIKTRLANGERAVDIVNDLNVSRNIVDKIKQVSTWDKLLPELNDILKNLIRKYKYKKGDD